jgi:thymidylate kinase
VDQCLAARLLRWLSPRPAIAYWFDVTPETARARATDGEPAEFLAQESAVYQRCVDLYGLRRVDGARPSDKINDGIVREVLATYFGRYHTVLNSIFLKNPGQWR